MRAEELKGRAEEALANAYSPYSGIRVAAALEAADGRVFIGVNVENASYGLTVCAERNAVSAAVAGGAREFTSLAVVTDSSEVLSPCGSCRQVLYEFNPDLQIWFYGPNGYEKAFRLKQLLPDGFSL